MGLDYVEWPDLSLSALQRRFTLPSELEELYQRYEQRFQVGESFFGRYLIGPIRLGSVHLHQLSVHFIDLRIDIFDANSHQFWVKSILTYSST